MVLDRRIALFGTDEAPTAARQFDLGTLRFTLEGADIRHVHSSNVEVVRGIQYLLRDENWATPGLVLEPPDIEIGRRSAYPLVGAVRVGGIDLAVTGDINGQA